MDENAPERVEHVFMVQVSLPSTVEPPVESELAKVMYQATGADSQDAVYCENITAKYGSEAEMPRQQWMVSFEDVADSFRLAMESAGIDEETITEIVSTATDAAVNNLGDD